MSWHLGGSVIPYPDDKTFKDSIQLVNHRTLGGKNTIQYLGLSKKQITVSWENLKASDYAVISGHYFDQVANKTKKLLVVDEMGFSAHVLMIGDTVKFPMSQYYDYISFSMTFLEE